jgi:hypothetical protein
MAELWICCTNSATPTKSKSHNKTITDQKSLCTYAYTPQKKMQTLSSSKNLRLEQIKRKSHSTP